MFCPKCARKNPDHNKFCNGCGSSLRVEVFPPVTPTQVAPTPAYAPPPPPPRPIMPVPVNGVEPGDNKQFDFLSVKTSEAAENTEKTEIYHGIIWARDDRKMSEGPEGGEDMSKVFEETEALLDDLFTDKTIVSDFETGEFAAPARESELTPLPDSAKAENALPIEGRISETKFNRGRGIAIYLIVGGTAAALLLIAVAFVAFRLSADPASATNGNTGDTKLTDQKPVANQPPPGMAYVPGGEFMMGSDTGDGFSKPAHTATVNAFFMDITEVTNEQYKKFIDANPSHKSPGTWVNGTFQAGKQKFPVTGVNWDDANAYARWADKRLPTEQEWEFAARGTDGRMYPWGPVWNPDLANADKQTNGMVEVGSRLGKSPFGLVDMSGNAFEWTSSEAAAYTNGNSFPPGTANSKILRGGYFGSSKNKEGGIHVSISTHTPFY